MKKAQAIVLSWEEQWSIQRESSIQRQ